MTIDFNINQAVYVRLTPHGRAVHKQNHTDFWASVERRWPPYDYIAPKEDSEGWSRWQLHELMLSFGQHVGLCKELPFETEIRLDLKS